jgi:hypothetical protein
VRAQIIALCWTGLESLRSRFLSEINQLTAEAAHARDDIARPFQQAEQLAAARDRVARLDEQLQRTAAPPQRSGDDGLVAAAMHDAVVMAGISGAPIVVPDHRDSQPLSAVQLSRSDFPVDTPLAGTAPSVGSYSASVNAYKSNIYTSYNYCYNGTYRNAW